MKMTDEMAIRYCIAQRENNTTGSFNDNSGQWNGLADRIAEEGLEMIEEDLSESTDGVSAEFISALTDNDIIIGYVAYDLRTGKVQEAITAAIAEIQKPEIMENLTEHREKVARLSFLLSLYDDLEHNVEDGNEDFDRKWDIGWNIRSDFDNFYDEFVTPAINEAVAPYAD